VYGRSFEIDLKLILNADIRFTVGGNLRGRGASQELDQEDESLGQAPTELEFKPRPDPGVPDEVHHCVLARLCAVATKGCLREDSSLVLVKTLKRNFII